MLLQLLDAYFGKDDNLDPAGAFLKSYLAKKAWKQPTDDRSGSNKKRLRGLDGSSSSSEDAAQSSSDGEDSEAGAEQHLDVDDEEDEEFLEEVDKFEAAYNFR